MTEIQQFLDRGKFQTYAENAVFNDLLRVWRGRLQRTYLERLNWIHRIKLDAVYRKVMKILQRLIDEGNMDSDEAAESALEMTEIPVKQSPAGEVIPQRVG